MGSPGDGLHARERRKLRQIEEGLGKDYPGLDALLRGGGRPASRARVGVALAGYLVLPALLAAGLVSHVTWLVVTGAVLCPLIPVIAWLTISRHYDGGAGHGRWP
jgi:hypothetical protein